MLGTKDPLRLISLFVGLFSWRMTFPFWDNLEECPSLTLETLFIKRFAPELNTKDEYRSRTLTLKF